MLIRRDTLLPANRLFQCMYCEGELQWHNHLCNKRAVKAKTVLVLGTYDTMGELMETTFAMNQPSHHYTHKDM